MEEFLALFQGHFKQGTFVKLTLSKPASKVCRFEQYLLEKSQDKNSRLCAIYLSIPTKRYH